MQLTDFKRLAVELLPVCLRKPVMTSLLRSLMQGIVIAYMEFLSWKEERDYEIKHNGQVCHLRGMLNDAFDPIQRKITITDTEEKETMSLSSSERQHVSDGSGTERQNFPSSSIFRASAVQPAVTSP